MDIPTGKQVFEDELGYYWLDDEGIFNVCTKRAERTVEKQKQTYALIHKITSGNKVCVLSDTTNIGALSKEARAYSAEQMPLHFKAMALASTGKFGILLFNTFMALNGQPIPIKMCATENEARQWLRKYL